MPVSPGESEKGRYLLFLDFDGVLCDSVRETFVSSWIGYYQTLKKNLPDFVAIDRFRGFRELRPFIRESEDYILIQELLSRGIAVPDQKFFDAQVSRTGAETMAAYKNAMEAARRSLIAADRKAWLRLNPLFPGISSLVAVLMQNPDIYILSTKKPEYIREILGVTDVKGTAEKIRYSGNKKKLIEIRDVLEKRAFDRAVFVDDQIDHLAANDDPRIDCCLPDWGYVRPEWLVNRTRLRVISLNDLFRLIRDA